LDKGDRERGKRAVNKITVSMRRVTRVLQATSASRFAQRSRYSNGCGVDAGFGLD